MCFRTVLRPLILLMALTTTLTTAPAAAADDWPDLPGGGERFFTFFVTWVHDEAPELLEYVRDARPEVVQIGFYGPMFHGYAHHEDSTGYPMRLPVSGERDALERQTRINRDIRDAHPEARIVGHFQMSTVVGDPHEPFGFIKWYNEHWDEDLMGPKPVEDVAELLQRDADGEIIHRDRYIGMIELCISSPHTRQLMTRSVEIAINAGVDGLMSNYNYRRGCVCHWCQDAFKRYLRERHDDAALQEKFGIADLDSHTFDEIPAHMPGYPDVDEATELHWAAADWGARHFKQVFDEVLIEHGRSLKPDLLIGTWNHSAFIPHHDERAFTPVEAWHRGENYFWYSGAHGEGDLAEGDAGDAWPHLLWLREMAEGKPFMVGKYVSTRIRVALAEGVATGGAGTGLRHHFVDDHARRVMARHHNFVHDHRALYAEATPRSEVGVLLPRQSALNRQPQSYDAVRAIAPKLAEAQVLFDFVLDQRLDPSRLAAYDALVLPTVLALSDAQRAMIRDYVANGGRALIVGELATLDERGEPRESPGIFNADRHAARIAHLDADETGQVVDRLESLTADAPLSSIDGSWKQRAAAFDRPDGMVLHLVNYDRDEAAAEGESGPAHELPLSVHDLPVELNLPEETSVASVTLRSPDHTGAIELDHTTRDGRLSFTVPEIEVYGVVDVRFGDTN